jgi:hypothetical protein
MGRIGSRWRGLSGELTDTVWSSRAAAVLAKGEPTRVRVGDYRMVYTVHDDQLLVVVIDLGHRREIYRSLICHAEADPTRRPAHHR